MESLGVFASIPAGTAENTQAMVLNDSRLRKGNKITTSDPCLEELWPRNSWKEVVCFQLGHSPCGDCPTLPAFLLFPKSSVLSLDRGTSVGCVSVEAAYIWMLWPPAVAACRVSLLRLWRPVLLTFNNAQKRQAEMLHKCLISVYVFVLFRFLILLPVAPTCLSSTC